MHNILKNAHFLDENVKNDAIGCGILPVAKDEHGRTCFLLAKEQHVPYWRGSHKWSAFEGGRHVGESIEETAIREWTEESVESILPITTDMLIKKDYICKYTLNVIQNKRTSQPSNSSYHVTYAVEIPYNNEYPSIFTKKREALIALNKLSKTLKHTNGDILSIKYIDDDKVKITEKNEEYEISKDDEQIFEMINLTKTIDDLISTFSNLPGVVIVRYENNMVKSIFVNEDYLEKEKLRWWTLEELRDVLYNGGRMEDEVFRVYFLPVLEGMVDFFSNIDCENICHDCSIINTWDGLALMNKLSI